MEKNAYQKMSSGEQLLHALHSLTNMVRIYQGNNQLVRNCLVQLTESMTPLMTGAGLRVQLENGRFFINEEKLPRRRGVVEHVLELFYEFLTVRGIGALQFRTGIMTAPPEALVGFAVLLNECGERVDGPDWLDRQFRESGLDWVSVQVLAAGSERPARAAGERERRRPEPPGQRSPRKVYAYTLRSLRDVAQKISVNQRVGMRKAVRMVQTMVEEVFLQEQPLLLAMSTIRAYDDYTFTHSVNVAILSLYIGRQLGLPRETMECLGVCGLFHDLGKVTLPYDLLNKSEALTSEESAQLRRHSLDSTRLIVQLLAAPADRKSRVMIPPFEHHLKYDLSGYPVLGWTRPISLCGRILTIADVYDALTSPRVYRKEAMSADRALGLMVQGLGTVFDPLILKVFIRMLGVYPIGTLLELDNGEIALVSRAPLAEDLHRPWVVILREDGQGGFVRGAEVNLAEQDRDGGYCRRIVGSSHPSSRNIQPASFLT
jgi:HD-GYP domain-containing protein (c-di-GMP phosphodiesterase class II)